MLPNFLIIGAAKAGTTALHRYLALHPDVGMAKRKELHLFAYPDWRSRIGWYESQFPEAAPARGESSPSYSMEPWIPGVPERVRELLPDARLIYLVRDPVERAVAHWVEFYSLYEEGRPFEEALAVARDADNPYVAASKYASQLEGYLRHFPEDRVLVLDQRRLRDERRSALREIFAFLSVDPGFWTPGFLESHNAREEKVRLNARGRWIHRRGWLPRLQSALPRMPAPLRRATLAAVADPVETPQLDARLRERLQASLHPDAERLRALTGQRFDHWSV